MTWWTGLENNTNHLASSRYVVPGHFNLKSHDTFSTPSSTRSTSKSHVVKSPGLSVGARWIAPNGKVIQMVLVVRETMFVGVVREPGTAARSAHVSSSKPQVQVVGVNLSRAVYFSQLSISTTLLLHSTVSVD
jgi:hypothetical protein